MKKYLTFVALTCVGMMTAVTASAQDVIEGTFVAATDANTQTVAEGLVPTHQGRPNWFVGEPGGIYGTGYNHSLLPEEIVTTIGGFAPGDVYNIAGVYTNLSFFDDDNLAFGHASGVLTDLVNGGDHSAVVGGSLGQAGSASAYDLNIGPQTVNPDGELKLYVNGSSSSNAAGFFLAYKGMTFDKVTTPLLGDVNMDESVSFLDISPFIGVLSSGEFQAEADINQDTDVTFLDIAPFIGILSGS